MIYLQNYSHLILILLHYYKQYETGRDAEIYCKMFAVEYDVHSINLSFTGTYKNFQIQ